MPDRTRHLLPSGPFPLTGDAAKAAGADWTLSDEARRDIEAIEDNVRQAMAMAPFLRMG